MRRAKVERKTRETRVAVELLLEGRGASRLQTGIPFFDHMLDQLARHGGLDLCVEAEGDLEVDQHHTVEDVGIAIGRALREALGDGAGIARFGHAYAPLDEALSRAVIDVCGRRHLEFAAAFPHSRAGGLDAEMVPHFFRSLADAAGLVVHLHCLHGQNAHHIVESLFKAFALALRAAIARTGETAPRSTKGALSEDAT
ncbi:MAG: imidazoleglycerol-phosphate dehydratase HisB [Planctomycetes bacterium]|nr:imidazoleglycerol-phosphate dehydratase HisB [Planctomycetota bacterium]